MGPKVRQARFTVQELLCILSSRKDATLLLLLFLMEFTRGAFFLTFLPLYAVNILSISIATAALAVSAHYTVETLCKTAAGWQLDRKGKPVLLGGLIMGLAALLLIKNYPCTPVLIAGSALLGLGASPVWLAVMSGVAPVEAENRASRVGAVFTVWLAGGGGGPVAVNFLISKGFHLAFWFLIGLWCICLFLALSLPPVPEVKKLTDRISFKSEIIRLAQNRAVKNLLLPGMFIQTASAGLLLPLLPVYAQDKIGLSPNQYAFLLLTGGAAAAITFLPAGLLTGRIRLKTLLGAGFGLAAVSLALFSLIKEARSAYLLAALTGLSYAIILPSWNNLLAKVISPQNQATGWGVFATIEGMGVAAGPAMGGLAARFLSITAAILLSAAILATMSCFYFLYPIEKFLLSEK